MSDNVVALPGYTVPTTVGEPVKGVIEVLEDALIEARAGTIKAIGVARVYSDGTSRPMTSNNFCGSGFSTELEVAARRLLRHIQDWADE